MAARITGDTRIRVREGLARRYLAGDTINGLVMATHGVGR